MTYSEWKSGVDKKAKSAGRDVKYGLKNRIKDGVKSTFDFLEHHPVSTSLVFIIGYKIFKTVVGYKIAKVNLMTQRAKVESNKLLLNAAAEVGKWPDTTRLLENMRLRFV